MDERFESTVEFQGSKYQDRMFIKLLTNRKLLRSAAQAKVWPLLENVPASDKRDPGMNQFWHLLSTIDKTVNPSNGYLLLMKELSSYTSSLAIMPIFKTDLADQLVKFLKEGKSFWRGTSNIDNHMLMRQNYPVLMDIILELSDDHKSIYGFSLMLTGETPKMLFDIIMTRFEPDYNPFIIYDASCKVHSLFI